MVGGVGRQSSAAASYAAKQRGTQNQMTHQAQAQADSSLTHALLSVWSLCWLVESEDSFNRTENDGKYLQNVLLNVP